MKNLRATDVQLALAEQSWRPSFEGEIPVSRGFDGFEIHDFRDRGSRSGQGVDRGSSSDWNSRNARHNIWQEERVDRLDRESRERDRDRPPQPQVA